MAFNIKGITYIPGMYSKAQRTASELANIYIKDLENKKKELQRQQKQDKIPPVICFSRKIGVGAMEVADILSTKISYRVIDREILTQIAEQGNLREKTVSFFDEKYPGKVNEFLSFLFGEKSFVKSDYTKHLFSAALSIANFEPTIFVGRGIHLILPRDRVLAVRFISDDEHRIQRLSRILEVNDTEIRGKIKEIDKEQREFFKKVYNKKDASPYEFDMVINFSFIKDPYCAAEIVEQAFKSKFKAEIK